MDGDTEKRKRYLAESAEDAEFGFFFLIRFSERENLISEFP